MINGSLSKHTLLLQAYLHYINIEFDIILLTEISQTDVTVIEHVFRGYIFYQSEVSRQNRNLN